jgi:hypothetical protein
MRSSSVKTFVSVVTITFTLAIAAPAVARPAQPRASQTRSTQAGMSERVQRVVRQVIKRFFGITANGLPTDPIPGFTAGTSTASGLPTDPIPVSEP